MTLTHVASLFGNETTAAWLAEIDPEDLPVFMACREGDDRLGGVWWSHGGRWLGALPGRTWITGTAEEEYMFREVEMDRATFGEMWAWLMGRDGA